MAATCRCSDYKNRTARVHDCVRLTPDNLSSLNWLPPTCAYRLVGAGRDLYWWHPLVSGDPETVHAAGVSVRGRVFSDEDALPEDALGDHIVSWPTRLPKGAKGSQPVGADPADAAAHLTANFSGTSSALPGVVRVQGRRPPCPPSPTPPSFRPRSEIPPEL